MLTALSPVVIKEIWTPGCISFVQPNGAPDLWLPYGTLQPLFEVSLFCSLRRKDQHLSCKAWLCAHLAFAMNLATSALPIKVIFLFLAPSRHACCNWLLAISFSNRRIRWTLNWIVAHLSPLVRCIRLTCKMLKPLSSWIYRLMILAKHRGGPVKRQFPFLNTVAQACGHLWVSQFTPRKGEVAGGVTLPTARLLKCTHSPFWSQVAAPLTQDRSWLAPLLGGILKTKVLVLEVTSGRWEWLCSFEDSRVTLYD